MRTQPNTGSQASKRFRRSAIHRSAEDCTWVISLRRNKDVGFSHPC
jgi:hypothetical protein